MIILPRHGTVIIIIIIIILLLLLIIIINYSVIFNLY